MTKTREIDNSNNNTQAKLPESWKNQFVKILTSGRGRKSESLIPLWTSSSNELRAYLSGQPYTAKDGKNYQLSTEECIAIFKAILKEKGSLKPIAEEILLTHQIYHLIKKIKTDEQAKILNIIFTSNLGGDFLKKYKVAVDDIEVVLAAYPDASDTKRTILIQWMKQLKPDWRYDPKILALLKLPSNACVEDPNNTTKAFIQSANIWIERLKRALQIDPEKVISLWNQGGLKLQEYFCGKKIIMNGQQYQISEENYKLHFALLSKYEKINKHSSPLKMNDPVKLTENHSEDKSTMESDETELEPPEVQISRRNKTVSLNNQIKNKAESTNISDNRWVYDKGDKAGETVPPEEWHSIKPGKNTAVGTHDGIPVIKANRRRTLRYREKIQSKLTTTSVSSPEQQNDENLPPAYPMYQPFQLNGEPIFSFSYSLISLPRRELSDNPPDFSYFDNNNDDNPLHEFGIFSHEPPSLEPEMPAPSLKRFKISNGGGEV